jgi:hypothetical protein
MAIAMEGLNQKRSGNEQRVELQLGSFRFFWRSSIDGASELDVAAE